MLKSFLVFIILFVYGCSLVQSEESSQAKESKKSGNDIKIESFDECAAAGYPIMRSYPAKCATKDGRIFTQELNEKNKKKVKTESKAPVNNESQEVAEEEISDKTKSQIQQDLNQNSEAACKDLCGDGQCQQIVCMAVGCPCAETPDSCPSDCASPF